MTQELPIQSFKLDEKGLTHIFGELEAKLMEAVWALDQPTVQDVIDHLGGKLNYKTTMTVMNRLVDKGILSRRKVGRAFVYAGTASRDELLASVFDKMVRGMFGEDFRQIALAQMIETAEAIDEQLLDDISDLIEQRKKNG
ncbi:MAG: BlaI/MecI/CopY family transcriptional regulator [Anaerolineae bacterium]|nr:BlaI/MecI/CopY family transcriptional regulator [Anaerolineae bacterium]